MRSAAKQLEFERAAAIRDEIQDIRLRVLEEDASTTVLKAAERARPGAPAAPQSAAASGGDRPSRRSGWRPRKQGDRRRAATSGGPCDGGHRGEVHRRPGRSRWLGAAWPRPRGERLRTQGTAADWLPGLRDEHEDDDAGWMARWLDKATWDRPVTPNVIKRTGNAPRGPPPALIADRPGRLNPYGLD